MLKIKVEGLSEKAYPRKFVIKADRVGALRVIEISEVCEGKFNFEVEVDDWAVINALSVVTPSNSEGAIPVMINGEEQSLPEWAIANIIIALLSTHQLNKLMKSIFTNIF